MARNGKVYSSITLARGKIRKTFQFKLNISDKVLFLVGNFVQTNFDTISGSAANNFKKKQNVYSLSVPSRRITTIFHS